MEVGCSHLTLCRFTLVLSKWKRETEKKKEKKKKKKKRDSQREAKKTSRCEKKLLQKRIVRNKLDIYVFINITYRYIC
jgi:hypothetical protein